MTKEQQPQAILVDWNRTLSFSRFWGHIKETDQELFNSIETQLFKDDKDLVDSWMRGGVTSERVIELVTLNLKLNFNDIFKEFVRSCENMEFSSSKIPQIIEMVKGHGIKTYIFTDNMDSFDRWTVPSMKLDEIFDGVINSYNVGGLKNDINEKGKNLFLEELGKRNLAVPQRLILFDDNPNTINTFKRMGVDSRLVTEKEGLEKKLIEFSKQL